MKANFDPCMDAERRAFATDDSEAIKIKLAADQTRPRIPLVQMINEPKDLEAAKRIIEEVRDSGTYKLLMGIY